jgi:hypothetical protein
MELGDVQVRVIAHLLGLADRYEYMLNGVKIKRFKNSA